MNQFDRVPNEILVKILLKVDAFTANNTRKVCRRFRDIQSYYEDEMKPFEFREVTISPSLPNRLWPMFESSNVMVTLLAGPPYFHYFRIYIEECEDADGKIKFDIDRTHEDSMYACRCYKVSVKNKAFGLCSVLDTVLEVGSFVKKLTFINMAFVNTLVEMLAIKFPVRGCIVERIVLQGVTLLIDSASLGRFLFFVDPCSSDHPFSIKMKSANVFGIEVDPWDAGYIVYMRHALETHRKLVEDFNRHNGTSPSTGN